MPIATANDRTIPYNLEAERAVLGSILLDNAALPAALKLLSSTDLYSQAHRIALAAMTALAERKSPIDLVTLSEELSQHQNLEKAGGAGYLAALTDGVPIGVAAPLAEYCRIIKSKSVSRHLIATAENLRIRALEGMDDPEILLALAQSQVADLQTAYAPPMRVISEEATREKKRKGQGRFYPIIAREAWHPAAELYRQAHELTTEGDDNWHFASFYTAVGALLGRTIGARMGGGRLVYPNLFCCLVGVIGGDGKDTCADEAMDFAERIDESLYIPEDISSKAGFCKFWVRHIQRRQIVNDNRAVLRLPEISSMLSVAAQKGTQSIVPMVMTNYAPRARLSNETVGSEAEILKPHLCILACGAKTYINQIPQEDLTGGLGRRICFVGGDTKGPKPRPVAPDSEKLNPLLGVVQAAITHWKAKQTAQIEFSEKSCRIWDDWYEKVYWRRKKGDELIPSMNNGDRVTCLKIATINAALDKADSIEPHHLKPALAFGDFLFECRWPIFSEHGANPNLELEKKILARVPDPPGRIGTRDLRRACHLDAKTFEDRLRYMTMEGGDLRSKQVGKIYYISKVED